MSCPDANSVVISDTMHCRYQKLKRDSNHDANFVVTDGIASYHNENI